MFNPQIKADNAALLAGLQAKGTDEVLYKESASTLNGYLGMRAKENSFIDPILPPVEIGWEDTVPQVDSLKPVVIRECEPNTTSAVSMPFGGTPMNHYPAAPRYKIVFDRAKSPRITADIANLRNYMMDIRQVLYELMLKDLLHEKDRKFMVTIDAVLGAAVNDATTARALEVQAKGWIELGGALSVDTLELLSEGLPTTNRHLDAAVTLMNNITAKRINKLAGAELSDRLNEQLFVKGFKEETIQGYRLITTIKTDLVATNVAYQFASPDFLGDHLVLEPLTLSTKVENWQLEMFLYMMHGGSVKNTGAFCKGTFGGQSAGTWTLT